MKKAGYATDASKLLSVAEVEQLVKADILPARKVIVARSKGFVSVYKKIVPVTNFEAFLKSRKIAVREEEASMFQNTLSGSPAFAGKKVKGQVKIVLNSLEMQGFQKGMVLVTPMTAPEYLPIMKIAAAIITNEGGITCHAAIVSRELKKPCIIGTKIATKIFKDGDLIEVDATKGIVRKL